MPTAYKVMKRVIQLGDRRGETVYNVAPVCYGTLTTDDVARQIAAESTASPGDVKNVLDRYAYYVSENLKKGYAIELLGCGKLYLRFVNGNDGTCEGVDYTDMPAFSVQFHPEACGGPLDTRFLFDRFIAMMGGNKECR